MGGARRGIMAGVSANLPELPGLAGFAGATGVSRLRVYDWPTADGADLPAIGSRRPRCLRARGDPAAGVGGRRGARGGGPSAAEHADPKATEYALRDNTEPLGVAEYQLVESLPDPLQTALPTH